MKENVYEQLNFELNEQLDLINKKKMTMYYLWATKQQHNLSDEENDKIIGAMTCVGTAKNQYEYEYYADSALSYVKKIIS
ncbi:hypothetical protein [Ornithinibacillus sp. JPR2-1]|uniref:hypothetical protein n=1 Tax=Ornithinibacillus sp. JPR2-1 TaxID=2094019 RepID=UPI0031CE1C8C